MPMLQDYLLFCRTYILDPINWVLGNIRFTLKYVNLHPFLNGTQFFYYLLKPFDNKEEAEAYEASIVNRDFTLREDTYNIALGGNVRIMYGKNNPFFGKSHSEESKNKINSVNIENLIHKILTFKISIKVTIINAATTNFKNGPPFFNAIKIIGKHWNSRVPRI